MPGIAALVALSILVGLGVWQLGRRAWKTNLVARIETRATAAPVPLLDALATPPADGIEGQGYRRVRAAGVYQPRLEAWVQGTDSVPGGSPVLGYDLLTPLLLTDGRLIVVNRGFVPAEIAVESAVVPRFVPAEIAVTSAEPPAGTVEVTGLLREPEARTPFLPPDDPARNLFYARDPLAIARAKGFADGPAPVIPLRLDAERTGDGWPRGGRSRLDLPNDHLQYALTWFGLAAGLAGVFGVYAARVLARRTETDLVDGAGPGA